MRALIAAAVVLVLGLGGIVFLHERGGGSSSSGTVSGAKIATISTGETVDISDHTQSGVYTVVEFTADW